MYFQYRNGDLIQDNIRDDYQNKIFWEAGRYGEVFSDWREGDILYIGESRLLHPVLENGNMREKTYLELIKEGLKELPEGQYLRNDEIVTVEIPKGLLRPKWNRELNTWVESITKKELVETRKNKILEYSKLEDEKRILEGSKFFAVEEIKAITERMAILEVDINNLQEKIKLL